MSEPTAERPVTSSPPPRRRLKFLLTTSGSHGDVHPFIAIAAALIHRGHDVSLIVNSHFEPQARNAGVDVVSSGPASEYEQALNHPGMWNPRGKARQILLAQGISQITPRVYRAIEERYEPGRTVVLAAPMSFGARIAQDKLGVPVATTVVSPHDVMSAYDPGVRLAHAVPLRVRKWLAKRAEEKALDPVMAPSINRVRAELSLPPVRRIHSTWQFAPGRVVCLWPDWFCAPQPDWPPQARTTGFVMYDGSGGRDLPEELKTFLAAGQAPVAFVPSTAMLNAGSFLAESVRACEITGRRGVLLSRGTAHVPASLPESVIHVDYAPFHRLFPQCKAVVHQGAIGTAAFALAAGLPQLAVPYGIDQPDNAGRLSRLGLCGVLPPKLYRGKIVAKVLDKLTWGKGVAANCARYKQLVNDARPLDQVCQMAEELAEMPATPATPATPAA